MDEWQALIRKGKIADPAAAPPRPPRPSLRRQAATAAPAETVFEGDAPPVPRSVEETDLSESYVTDLALKTLNLRGSLLGHEICNELKLPYQGVVQPVLTFLKDERLCEIAGGAGLTEMTWTFRLSDRGSEFARSVLRRDGYVGPAPVSLDAYVGWASRQRAIWSDLHEADIRAAVDHLVLNDDTIDRIGPAFTSGKPVLIYGNAGNGKTVLAEALASTLPDDIFIPYAVEAGGQTIRLYDASQHQIVPEPEDSTGSARRDTRWVRVKRPFIVVGGELAFEQLGLTFDPQVKCYIAPVQMKANGGILLIDDFGRQQVSPRDLLNRWIIPMEKDIDYHMLVSGVQIRVPFNVMLIFSTNLSPNDLMDEAFLRRIRYKLMIQDPTEEQYREIFGRVCQSRGIAMDPAMVDYLIRKHYVEPGRPFRASHPRDLLDQLIDIARYRGEDARLTERNLDQACNAYFVL
jgi:predicted ATPase with chaperone activity